MRARDTGEVTRLPRHMAMAMRTDEGPKGA